MQYITALVIASWLGCAYACSCLPRTDEEIYCSQFTKFGALIEVKKFKKLGKVVDGYQPYKIKVIQTYNSTVEQQSVKRNFLYTPVNGALCGVTLISEKYYVITGRYIDIRNKKGMYTESCDLQKVYNEEPTTYTPPTCGCKNC